MEDCNSEENVYSLGILEANDLEFKKQLSGLECDWVLSFKQEQMLLPWYKRPNIFSLYLLVFCYTLSFDMLAHSLMLFIRANTCTDNFPNTNATTSVSSSDKIEHLLRRSQMAMGMDNNSTCNKLFSSQVASEIGYDLVIIAGVLGFILSPKFGQYSDKYGRVYVFKFFAIVNTLQCVILIICFDWLNIHRQYVIIITISIGYFCGGITSLVAIANAYIVDTVEISKRTLSINILMGVIYLSLTLSPWIVSVLVEKVSQSSVSWFSLALAMASTVFAATFLRESNSQEAMAVAKERYHQKYETHRFSLVSSVASLFQPFKRLWLPRTQSKSLLPRINVVLLVLIDVFYLAASIGNMHILVSHCISNFDWSEVQIKNYLIFANLSKSFGLLIVAPLLHELLTCKLNFKLNPYSVDKIDRFLILASVLSAFLSLLLLSVSNTIEAVYVSIGLESLSVLVSPTVQTSLVKFSARANAGEMFGVFAANRHIQILLLPLLFLDMYWATVTTRPKIIFVMLSIFSFVCILISFFGLKEERNLERSDGGQELELSRLDE